MIALFQMFPPPHPRKLHVSSQKMYHRTHTLKMTFLEKIILAKLHTGIVKMQWVCFSLCVNTPTQQHPDCEFKRKTTKNKRLPSKDVLAISQSTKVGATLLQTH